MTKIPQPTETLTQFNGLLNYNQLDFNKNLFGHIYCEYISYCRKSGSFEVSEKMMFDVGYDMGCRLWELFMLKERVNSLDRGTYQTKNDIQQVKQVLEKIKDKYWKFLFGKPADSLDKIKSADTQYYLVDKNPVTDKFISYPPQYTGAAPSQLLGGIIKAALDASGIETQVEVNLVEKSKNQEVEFWTYFHITCKQDVK